MKVSRQFNLFITFCVFLSLALLSAPLWATGKKPTPTPPLAQEQGQDQDQSQSQHQEQSQYLENYNDLSNAGNTQSVSFSAPKRASSANAPGNFSNNPCYTQGSAALSVPNWSIGGGKPLRDPNCEKIQAALAFNALGYYELGLGMVCATDAAIEVHGDKCQSTDKNAVTLREAQIEELRAENEALRDQNAQMLSVREVDKSEELRLRDQVAKCESDLKSMDEACTK